MTAKPIIEPWEIWLNYRLPHWDNGARIAAETLTESRAIVVRTGFDGSLGQERAWHATVATLARETPDPAATIAACEPNMPAGHILHHVLVDELRPEHHEPDDPRAAELAVVLARLADRQGRVKTLMTDQRAPQAAKTARFEQLLAEARAIEKEVEQAAIDGLRMRHGMFLVPPLVVLERDLNGRRAYDYLVGTMNWLRGLCGDRTANWRPSGIAVCAGCTAVFRPLRRSTAEYCNLCRRRPPAPALGERLLDLSRPTQIRVPKTIDGGHLITGWRSVSIAICPSCEKPYHGRRDAAACSECSPKLRQRRRRAPSSEATPD